MDFVIGRVTPAGKANEKAAEPAAPLEARLLHVRLPRRSRDAAKGNTRSGGSPQVDPPGARVLVLLVPDGFRLPDDLNERNYRIFIRIARK